MSGVLVLPKRRPCLLRICHGGPGGKPVARSLNLANTDRIDARMLALFGAERGPSPTPPPDAARAELAELSAPHDLQFPARHLQLLNQIGGSGEEDAPTVLDQGEADGGEEAEDPAPALARIAEALGLDAGAGEVAILAAIHDTATPDPTRPASSRPARWLS